MNDLAELHYIFLRYINQKNKNVLINCGYGKGSSVNEVIQRFEKILGKKIIYELVKSRKGDIPYSVSNISKLKKLIKWTPKFSNIDKSIKETILWNEYLKNKRLI